MIVYLDNCCFNRPFDDQSQLRVRLESEAKLSIQDAVRNGEHQLIWSYILDFENEGNPYEERKTRISEWKNVASQVILETPEILQEAMSLNQLGFKKLDSLHLACALAASCDIFFTSDDGILNKREKTDRISIMNPVEYFTGEHR